MFEFDVNDFLSDLEGMQAKEKIEALEDLCDELECAMQEVLSAMDDINYEYERKQRQKLTAELHAYIEKEGLLDSVKLVEKSPTDIVVTCPDYHNRAISIQPLCRDAKWNIYISVPSGIKRESILAEIARAIGTPYKHSDYFIKVPVSEGELSHKMVELIGKIINSSEK